MIGAYLRMLEQRADQGYKDQLLALADHNPSHILLDVGCGDGLLTRRLAESIGTTHVIGTEAHHPTALEAARKGIKMYQSNLNVPFPLADASVDVVHACQLIEHIYDLDVFVDEIYRVLKPGGYALIATVNIASWHNIAAMILGWQPFTYVFITQKRVGNPLTIHGMNEENTKWRCHVHPFTMRALRDIFEQRQFTIEATKGSGYLPFPPPLDQWLASIDQAHAVCLTLKARKPLSKS